MTPKHNKTWISLKWWILRTTPKNESWYLFWPNTGHISWWKGFGVSYQEKYIDEFDIKTNDIITVKLNSCGRKGVLSFSCNDHDEIIGVDDIDMVKQRWSVGLMLFSCGEKIELFDYKMKAYANDIFLDFN